MPVAIVGSPVNNGANFASSPSQSITVPATTDCLVVALGNDKNATSAPSTSGTVSYGGVSLTKVRQDGGTSIWRLLAPTVGTASLAFSDVSQNDWAWTVYFLSGVNQTTPTPNTAGAARSFVTNTSDSITCPSGGMVIDCLTIADGFTATAGSGQTPIPSGTGGHSYGTNCQVFSSSKADATSMAWTHIESGSGCHTVVAFAPVASGTTLISPTVVSAGNTIATVRVTTDTAPTGSAILAVQVLPAATADPSSAAILASPTQTITSGASGARDFNLTGLTNGTAVKAHFTQTGGNVVSTASFTPSTVPGAPTIGTAVAGNAQATVNGTAPASNGGSAITGYRSTATPGGSTVTGASLPITHTGLTNGTGHTFTLAAQNATNGYGAESAASNSVTPSAGGIAPSIATHPSNQTVTAGAAATFSASASGTPTPTVQWQRNGADISGATSNSYTTPATTVTGGSANNGDTYRAGYTNASGGPVYTNAATLTVNAPGGAYTAQTDIIAVAGIPLVSTLVYFSWAPNGRPGSITSPVNGTTTTDSAGRATISHTVAGQGFVIIGTRPGPTVSNDRVFAQFLTLA